MLILVLCIVGYVALFGSLAVARHWGLKTQLADLGNMDQAISQTLEGSLMRNTSGGVDTVRLSGHMNILLFAFVPLYALGAEPELLLILQSIAVALVALPLFWFAREKLHDPWLAVGAAIVYLANPMMQDAQLYDFHPEVFAVVFLAFAFYYLQRRAYRPFLVFAVLTAIAKEDLPLVVAMFGLYAWIVQKNWRVGVPVFVGSLAYFFLMTAAVMPALRPDGASANVLQRYGTLGDSIPEIVASFVQNPGTIAQTLFTGSRFMYALTLLLPFAALPILAPTVLLITVPSFLINLLTQTSCCTYRAFGFYYSSAIITILAFASVQALAWVRSKRQGAFFGRILIFVVAMLTGLFAFLTSPAPYSQVSTWEQFAVSAHAQRLSEVTALIPADASLAVQNNLGAHLSQRRDIFTFPRRITDADYVLIDAADPNAQYRGYRAWHFLMSSGRTLEQYAAEVRSVFANPDYGVVAHIETYTLFRRGAPRDQNAAAEVAFNQDVERMRIEFRERYGVYYSQIVGKPPVKQ